MNYAYIPDISPNPMVVVSSKSVTVSVIAEILASVVGGEIVVFGGFVLDGICDVLEGGKGVVISEVVEICVVLV